MTHRPSPSEASSLLLESEAERRCRFASGRVSTVRGRATESIVSSTAFSGVSYVPSVDRRWMLRESRTHTKQQDKADTPTRAGDRPIAATWREGLG